MSNFINYIRDHLRLENDKDFEEIEDLGTSTFVEKFETSLDSVSDKTEEYPFNDYANLLDFLDKLDYEETSTESKDKFLELLGDENIESSSSDIDENKINKNRVENFKKEKTSKFLRILREEQFEYGYASESEEYIRELFDKNELATKYWLNDLYIDYYNNVEIVVGILRVIGRFEQFEISPVGGAIALTSLSHKDIEVVESGIRVFESWGSRDNIEILKNLELKEDWLNDYLNNVIEDLS